MDSTYLILDLTTLKLGNQANTILGGGFEVSNRLDTILKSLFNRTFYL